MLFSRRAGGSRSVSRLEPSFAAPGRAAGEPLGTLILSRTPISIKTSARGQMVITAEGDCRCSVNGRPLVGACEFAPEELERGVLVELAGAVLLLLHFVQGSDGDSDDLGLFGDSSAIRQLRGEIRRLADVDTSVLILGESGSGKELVARAIHACSPRANAPFVAVNAAAIPPSVAAAALFGHVRGAYTGAVGDSPGYFGKADRGTLFLDEIGEVPREIQASLLRVLREGEVQPAGATQPRRVNVRVLAATDADLEALSADDSFAMPLFRRLEAYTIEVPPLRVRRDDIARLFVRFLRQELEALGESAKLAAPDSTRKPWLPLELMRALVAHVWSGNVAELQTVARRVAVSNRGERRFQWDSWLSRRLGLSESAELQSTSQVAELPAPLQRRDVAALSDADVVAAMRSCEYKVVAAARRLGVSRSWLHTRLEFCEGLRKAKELTEAEILEAAAQSTSSKQMAQLLEVSEHGLKLRMKALGIERGQYGS